MTKHDLVYVTKYDLARVIKHDLSHVIKHDSTNMVSHDPTLTQEWSSSVIWFNSTYEYGWAQPMKLSSPSYVIGVEHTVTHPSNPLYFNLTYYLGQV